MPSWNIHMAHSLAAKDVCARLDIDYASFCFGSIVPDIYVGYMVADTTKLLAYTETHFADPSYVPVPDWRAFWQLKGEKEATSLELGALSHLVADAVWNASNNAYLAEHGILPGDVTRQRKQHDFEVFGRSLELCEVPELSESLVAEAQAFFQYEIAEADVKKSLAAMADIYQKNQGPTREARYVMLDADFFERSFKAAQLQIEQVVCDVKEGKFDGCF